jgi:nucleotide-binding universal stress UspA family protein
MLMLMHLDIEYVQIKAETLILDGDPKDMICQAAEQMHADLLVVGSRGLGKIKR